MKKKKFLLLIIPLLLITLMVFTLKNTIFSNAVNQQEKQAGDELEEDNWEISTVFYDSTVNNGNTPLTEINWDATNYSEEREIRVQINYKNSSIVNNYETNKLSIVVNQLTNYNNYYSISAISAGALENGYDWNYTARNGIITFKNNVPIEAKSNLEGSIQITYRVTAEKTKNNTNQVFNATLKYNNNTLITSNDIVFNFTSNKKEHTIISTPSKIKNYEGLPDGADNYIWVKWSLTLKSDTNNVRKLKFNYSGGTNPRGRFDDATYFIENVSNNAIVLDKNLNILENNNGRVKVPQNNVGYFTPASYYELKTDVFIGYPKSEFSNSTIVHNVDAYGIYWDEEEDSYLANLEQTVSSEEYVINDSSSFYYKIQSGGNSGFPLSERKLSLGMRTDLKYNIDGQVTYGGTKYDFVIVNDGTYLVDDSNQYRLLNDDEYYFKEITYVGDHIRNSNNTLIKPYDFEIYVRYSNSSDYVLFSSTNQNPNQVANKKFTITFPTEEKVVAYKIVLKNVNESLSGSVGGAGWINNIVTSYKTTNIGYSNLSAKTYAINSIYAEVLKAGTNELIYTPEENDYNNMYVNGSPRNQSYFESSELDYLKTILKENDLTKLGGYKKRALGVIQQVESNLFTHIGIRAYPSYIYNVNMVYHPSIEKYKGSYQISSDISIGYGVSNHFEGLKNYTLLPEGMDVENLENISTSNSVRMNNGQELTSEYIKSHTTYNVIRNWNNTNRVFVEIIYDFSDNPIDLTTLPSNTLSFQSVLNVTVTVEAELEFGQTWKIQVYEDLVNRENADFVLCWDNGGGNEQKSGAIEPFDFNNNGTLDYYFNASGTLYIVDAVSSNQDVQTSVQSDQAIYSTGKVPVTNNSEYIYKLRVRTGQNDVTNLVIYDSLEKNTKDSSMTTISASGTKPSWQGEFLGVDTSYAESKGFNVKVYYSEEEQPDNIKKDTSWHEYNDSIDKTKVKSLAFEYLDEHGNPVILPANTSTYVLIKMKAPSEAYKTFAYNGCWTEWNAIDSITGNLIDYITGINSNIVRVALPSSVDAVNQNITITKKWVDNNNSINMRPTSITLKIIANNDYANPIEVTLTNSDVVSGNSNQWSKAISVPKYDDYGEEIDYKVYEHTITINDEYVYTSSVDGFNVTNTLNIKKNLKKYWQDNHNAYLTRPANVTFIVKQNSNNFKEVVITGDYAEDEWSKDVILPIFDNNGNRYTYTIDEEEVPNYVATDLFDVIGKLNTLTGTRNLTITKKWVDNNNSYDTRPNSVEVKLKQNGNEYQTLTLNSSSNWTTNLEVPMYDENGVKYTYTVEEESITPYGLTEYNQDTLTITNTLKQNKEITIKKTWVDNNNEYNTRPDSLTITLLQNGNNYREITLTGTTNEWTTTVEVPKYDNNQEEYVYSIKETEQEEYSDITYSETDLSVINKLKKNVDLTITKNWVDENNKYLTRPEKVRINLYQNDKLYKELELTGNTIQVPDVPVYDDNQIKYNYRIEEVDTYEHYGKVTYDQTTLTVTNELTEKPSVTLYFTVINGYTLDGENVLFDEDGLRNILKDYDLDPNDEYLYTFELKNIDTGKVFTGKLSTKGVLEFKDIEYGTYRAVEKDDRYFAFAHMLEIQSVLGVKFTPDNNGGTITISPTGSNIIYGTNVVNKITPLNNKEKNPNTNSLNIVVTFFILLVSLIITVSLYIYLNKKRIIK